ncbi:MAG: hypothetical protein CBHOC_3269 [uncultured Caballeronia sp.]|nr:MAG: hypothetical protein CBHOC_3269 [uncultured Caballeronia sp.]
MYMYTIRAAWTCGVESAWSRFAKFQLLNRLNWTQLDKALAIRPAINTREGIDLRAADSFRLADLADTLHMIAYAHGTTTSSGMCSCSA